MEEPPIIIMSNKPKPTALRVLEGNRGHRPIPENPQPALSYPKPPRSLDGNRVARREWRKRGKALYNLGILTELDLPAFEMYCVLYSQWYNADADRKMAYAKEARMFMNEFGMTPSSRTKIHVKEKDDDGGMKALLDSVTYS